MDGTIKESKLDYIDSTIKKYLENNFSKGKIQDTDFSNIESYNAQYEAIFTINPAETYKLRFAIEMPGKVYRNDGIAELGIYRSGQTGSGGRKWRRLRTTEVTTASSLLGRNSKIVAEIHNLLEEELDQN